MISALNKKIVLYFFITLCTTVSLFSQRCDVVVQGYVLDSGNLNPLEDVNIYFQENTSGTATDSLGYFSISDVCPGDYHVTFSHVGCASQKLYIPIVNDTFINVFMDHSVNVIDGVILSAQKDQSSTQSRDIIKEKEILDRGRSTLAEIASTVPGVTMLKTGSTVTKPIVHGLYGNRITILNNGIVQGGQQWGNDHSPEIDPFMASSIEVVKGVSALAYPGSQLGGMIIVSAKPIEDDPHIHGKLNYAFSTNGRSHTVNARLRQNADWIKWKLNGTLKKNGDLQTPDYYLNNTGHQEHNYSLQLEKDISDHLITKLLLSSYNARIGVLRGSHISNLTDLESAYSRDIPFFTEEQFSYEIEAPSQQVQHLLGKWENKYFTSDNQWINFTLATQINHRKEYDVRRGNRSDKPALSLKQSTFFGDLNFHHESIKNRFTTGIQLNIIDNSNIPETGILPLIPDYASTNIGAFITYSRRWNKFRSEYGLRYDYIYRDVARIEKNPTAQVVRYKDTFGNLSGTVGSSYEFNQSHQLSLNVGIASRNPAINELYSAGLHQGVSGIEEGNTDLKHERSIKTTLEYGGKLKHLGFSLLSYFQYFDNYIYLNPDEKLRLTIRGAYPLYTYEQTDALIMGSDLSLKAILNQSLYLKGIFSFTRGTDLTNDVPLIYMPPVSTSLALTYEHPEIIHIAGFALDNVELSLKNKYFGKQHRYNENQDFIPPPEAYNLLDFHLAAEHQIQGSRLRFTFSAENILNKKYRNYLNRQRYFADEIGRNISMGLSLSF